MRLPARLSILAPASDERRDRIEQAVLDRLAALRAAAEVPASDAHRDRVERRVFERLDAIRDAERVMPELQRVRRGPWLGAGVAIAAAAAVVALVLVGAPTNTPLAPSASRVVTPPNGSSRFVIGDAVIDAGGDTSVDVVRGRDGSTTLTLARGTIECDVTPRPGRAPFVVIAGDATVRVVGTRFTVRRTPHATFVDVVRGRVVVTSPHGTAAVAAGERWSSDVTVTAAAGDAPGEVAGDAAPAVAAGSPPAETAVDAEPAVRGVDADRATVAAPSGRPAANPATEAAYMAAQRLEAVDPAGAANAYRAVADGRGAYAASALHALVQLEADRGRVDAALAAAREYLRRFPASGAADDVAWLRVQALAAVGRGDASRVMAADYLRRFPSGTYATAARRLVDSP